MPRFYLPDTVAPDTLITLPDASAHHAARVLRLSIGDAVTLFNGRGGEWACSIHRIGKREVEVRVGAWQGVERETPLRVTLDSRSGARGLPERVRSRARNARTRESRQPAAAVVDNPDAAA